MSRYRVELVGLPNRPAGARDLEVDLHDAATLAELTSALREASPELEGSIIEAGVDSLAGHLAYNVNGRFHLDEYDLIVHPRDRIVIVALAMGG
jgi:hypothetical protein